MCIRDSISRFERPVLIMHGDRDEVVPLSYSESAAEEYEEEKLEVFAGEIHGFTAVSYTHLDVYKRQLQRKP